MLGTLSSGQLLLSGFWAPHILPLFKLFFQFHTNVIGSFRSL